VQRSTAPRRSMRVRTMAWAALLGGLVGSASPAQPASLTRSPTVFAGRSRVTLQTPQTIFQGQETALIVGVSNTQGQPVDGVLVAFQVDACRTPYASIRPAQAYTQGGRLRAIVRSALLGRGRNIVRVGTVTQRTLRTVVMPLAMGEGPREAYGARPAAPARLPGFSSWGEGRISPRWSTPDA
jgi:hypothetical protein